MVMFCSIHIIFYVSLYLLFQFPKLVEEKIWSKTKDSIKPSKLYHIMNTSCLPTHDTPPALLQLNLSLCSAEFTDSFLKQIKI